MTTSEAVISDLETPRLTRAQARSARHANLRPAFRPDVEGMRAIAVLLVVLYHAGIGFLPGGYVGVDIFFVISGFLITSLLLREFDVAGRISIAEFYARRFRRILPAAALVTVVSLGLAAILLPIVRIAEITKDALWTSAFLANYRFSSTGTNYLSATAPPSPLQHFWSLAVEEQFYVVWPLLLWIVLHVGRRLARPAASVVAAVVVATSFIWCVHLTGTNGTVAYFSPFTRAWELGVGALVAITGIAYQGLRMPRWLPAVLGWIGLAMMVYAAVRFDASTAFPGSAAALPVGGAALLLIGGRTLALGSVSWILALPPMQWIGKLSYSWYLWHWPLLIIATQRNPDMNTAAKLGVVFGALGLSYATFRIIENPIRRSQPLLRSTPLTLIAGLATIVVVLGYSNAFLVMNKQRVELARSLAKTAFSSADLGQATADEVLAAVVSGGKLDQLPQSLTVPLALAADDKGEAFTKNCVVGISVVTATTCHSPASDSKATKIVLLGDSHAAQWMPTFTSIARRIPIDLTVLTKQSCPVADVPVINPDTKVAYTQCDEWRQAALDKVKAERPDLVVVGEHIEALQDKSDPKAWGKGLAKSLATLKATGARIAVLGDVPAHAEVTPACLSQHQDSILKCADSPSTAILGSHEAEEQQAALSAGASYMRTRGWFCTDDSCPGVIANIVTSFDGTHMSGTYATYLARALSLGLGLETNEVEAKEAIEKALTIKAMTPNLKTELTTSSFGPGGIGGKCLYAVGEAHFDATRDCTFGDKSANRTVVIFGDSHAGMWVAPFKTIAATYGWKMILIGQAACNASGALLWTTPLHGPNPGCQSWHREAVDYITSLKPDLVVISTEERIALAVDGKASNENIDQVISDGLTKTINQFKSNGSRVAFLGDIPALPIVPPDCLAANESDISKCSASRDKSVFTAGLARERTAATATNTPYIETTPWLCTDTCPAVIDNHVTYSDEYHVTPNLAVSVTYALGHALGLDGS